MTTSGDGLGVSGTNVPVECLLLPTNHQNPNAQAVEHFWTFLRFLIMQVHIINYFQQPFIPRQNAIRTLLCEQDTLPQQPLWRPLPCGSSPGLRDLNPTVNICLTSKMRGVSALQQLTNRDLA